jgi:hypothetical protein
MILVSRDDTAYDTDFAIFYALYHIFKQESIQGRGTIKGRGMIKGMHLALYQIFKTTVFTTKYMINMYIQGRYISVTAFNCLSFSEVFRIEYQPWCIWG